eukprot:CAMPEP_0184488658 /NCGR_PEP_ID=MMETSP0113_2-20130426/12966_1 /TAXON_ID=91329 /ORGANISM="Norrisiella sphaerica, Strain BC52" /LENGTH=657 /DNA_ID=CAMNT_0026871593 /DNA_START=553 /DNA_END=2526 /DNA_ORIENTATION=-
MEFRRPTKTQNLLRNMELGWRVSSKIGAEMFTFRTKIGLAFSFTGVFAIGMVECGLMLESAWDHIGLMVYYSAYNVLPSMIWDTIPLEQIAQSYGFEAKEVMRMFNDTTESKQAQSLVSIHTHLLSVSRSLLASFMTLTQIIRMIQIGVRASSWHKDTIIDGREPPLHTGVYERFFRLAGSNSDVTELSIQRYQQSIIPVYGGDSFKEREALWRHSKKGRFPTYWQIRKFRYAILREWQPLFEQPDGVWYLRTKQGEKILYIEADATNVEEALALGKPATDLSISQASQAFRVLEMMANTHLTEPPDQIVKVFLADTKQKVELGGDNNLDLGRYVWQTKEADIIIDATAPLLQEVLDWCERVETSPEAENYEVKENKGKDEEGEDEGERDDGGTPSKTYGYGISWFKSLAPHVEYGPLSGSADDAEKEGTDEEAQKPKKTILFDTSNKDYFQIIGVLLTRHGYRVLDRGSVDPKASFHFPRLIYRETSADTLSLFHALMTRRLAEASKCCILIDSVNVRQELDYITKAQHKSLSPLTTEAEDDEKPRRSFKTICSAEIYDDLFRQVRIWTRMGYKPIEIQRELSARFFPMYKFQDDMKKKKEEEKEKKDKSATEEQREREEKEKEKEEEERKKQEKEKEQDKKRKEKEQEDELETGR